MQKTNQKTFVRYFSLSDFILLKSAVMLKKNYLQVIKAQTAS